MKNQILFLNFLLIFCSFQSHSPSPSEWQLAKDKNNIQVFTRSSPTSNLKDSKVVGVAESTPEMVLQKLLNFDGYDDWIPKCKESRLLKKVSETEFYYYARYAAPWPISDRDVIIHFEVFKEASGKIVCELNGMADYMEAVDGVIRVPYSRGKWFLTPQKNGGVEIINQYTSSPGGSIPVWLANTTAVSTPFDTMKSLLLQLK